MEGSYNADVYRGALPQEDALSADARVLEMRVYWGTILLDIAHHREPRAITIGETQSADVFIASDGLPTDTFPIIRTLGDTCVLTFTTAMDGEIERDGSIQPLATVRDSLLAEPDPQLEAAYRVTLPTHGRAIVHWEGITLAFRFVPPAPRLPRGAWSDLDVHAGSLLLMSLVVHLALVVTLMVLPRDAESLREDIFSTASHALLFEPPKTNDVTRATLEKLTRTQERSVSKIIREQPRQAPPVALLSAATGPRKSGRPDTKGLAPDAAMQRFRTLLAGAGGAAELIRGSSLSGALADAVGTMGVGAADGFVGTGIRGGLIPNGSVTASRGIARIGTIGRLGDPAYGVSHSLGPRKDHGIATLVTPVLVSPLPRELIQKVINENKAQIRYCYEIELQRDQALEGKVTMKWVIGATGAVAQAVVADSTMRNARVGKCLVEKIKGWRFPQPAGGGIVEVNYPFVFRSH